MNSPDEPTCVLAIDLGSGGPKVALVSSQGELLSRASARTTTQITADGGGEQDPHQWWQAITDCVRTIVGQRVVPIQRIAAVSVASQWSVTVPVDEWGQPLMNAVHWTDSRGAVYTKQVTNGLIKISGYGLRRLLQWVRLTGGVPTDSGADALAHILFIRHERPDVYRRTFKFLEPMDYLNMRLSGRAAASAATIFPYLLTDNRDNTHVQYDDGLIACCGLDRAKLPDILPVGTVLGPIRTQVAQEWGLSPTTQIIGGTPDSQAAAIGSGAVRDFEGHVCMGTTAWLSCHVPFKKTNLLAYLATMPSAIHGRNMVTAEQGAAGKCLEVFLDQWLCATDELNPSGPPSDYHARADRLAATSAPGSNGLLFLPWLNGAGPPSGEATIRGGFLNQSLRTDRADAIRAVMEGVAFNLRWLQGSVERFVGRPFDALNFIGGCARSELWCQIMADALDRPIRQMADPEMAISRGAAMVAFVALGQLPLEAVGSTVNVKNTFNPRPEYRQRYAQLFAEWLNSYKANRPIFRRLNAGHGNSLYNSQARQ